MILVLPSSARVLTAVTYLGIRPGVPEVIAGVAGINVAQSEIVINDISRHVSLCPHTTVAALRAALAAPSKLMIDCELLLIFIVIAGIH